MPSDYEEMEQESRLCPWIDDEGQEWVDNWDLVDDDDGQPSEYDEWQDYMGGDDNFSDWEVGGDW